MNAKKKRILKWVGIGVAVAAGIGLCVWLCPGIVAVLGSCAAPAAAALGAAGNSDRDDSEGSASSTTVCELATEQENMQMEDVLDSESCEKRSYTNPSESVICRGHIRNLHEGWHASEEKVQTAKESGIDLKDGQTLVIGYTKYNHIESDEERTNENRD